MSDRVLRVLVSNPRLTVAEVRTMFDLPNNQLGFSRARIELRDAKRTLKSGTAGRLEAGLGREAEFATRPKPLRNHSSDIRHDNLDPAFERERKRRYEYDRLLAISSTPFRFTQDEWIEICRQFGDKCLCCGSTEDITIDHVTPICKGGRNDNSNIQPLCRSCNSTKGRKIIDYRPR